MNRFELRKLAENSGFKCLDVHIYDDGNQANILCITRQFHLVFNFIITKEEFESPVNEFVNCHYQSLGIEGLQETRLYKGGEE